MGSHQHQRAQFWTGLQSDPRIVFKQGQLIKESKYLKQWRSRTVLLIKRFIVTLQQDESTPTAVIPLTMLYSLAKEEQGEYFIIKLITKDQEQYKFRTAIQSQRDEWFDKIKSEKVRLLKESKVGSSMVQQQQNRLTFIEVDQLQEIGITR